MKKYEADVKRLKDILNILEKRAAAAENLLSPFKKLSSDCADRIRNYGAQYLLFYLRQWWRAFLGVRDECMVLVNGQCAREYHGTQNENHVHERVGETKFYNKDCSLTICSVDGVDYEYRKLIHKFGDRSAFETIANRSESVGRRLHELYKAIETTSDTISIGVHCVPFCSLTCQLVRHYAETLEISLPGNNKDVTLQSGAFRKCSQIVSLGMVLEDHVEISNLSVGSSNHPAGPRAKSGKRKLELEDSSDEEQIKIVDVKPELDFNFSVSLAEIKGDYLQPDEATETSLAGTVADAACVAQSAPLISLQYEYINMHGSKDCSERMLLKFKVLDPRSSNESDHISLSIPMQTVLGPLNSSAPTKCDIFIQAADLLDELTKLLWLQPALTTEAESSLQLDLRAATDSKQCSMWLPKVVQMDGGRYTKGMRIPLPDLSKPKKFPVFCETGEEVLNLLAMLQNWAWQKDISREEILQRQIVLWEHNSLILSACAYSRKRSAAGGSESCLLWEIDCDRASERDSLGKDRCSTFKSAVMRYLSKDGGLRVKITSCAAVADLWTVCEHSTRVDASSSGLHATMLAKHSNATLACPLLQELDLSSNPVVSYLELKFKKSTSHLIALFPPFGNSSFVLPDGKAEELMTMLLDELDDAEWSDPWVDFMMALLTNAPCLRSLELANCVSNQLQLLLLLVGIVHAARRRNRPVAFKGSSVDQDILRAARRLLPDAGDSEEGVLAVQVTRSTLQLPSVFDVQ